jgi:hypothetical protein
MAISNQLSGASRRKPAMGKRRWFDPEVDPKGLRWLTPDP